MGEVIEKRASLLLGAIFIAGFCLRFFNLDTPCLWYDELCTYWRVNGSLEHTFSTLRVSPFPPLYYVLMNKWCGVFGLSEFSLRFPSMIFSTLSVALIYFLAKTMFGKREGMIAALLLSVSTYSINYAHEAKMYAMIWCLSILSFLFFFRFVNTYEKKYLIPYAIFSVLTIYTLYLGFVFIAVQNILFFLIYRKRTVLWMATNAVVLLCYIPWWFIALDNMANKSGIHWIPEKNYLYFFQNLFLLVSGTKFGDLFIPEICIMAALLIISLVLAVRSAVCHGEGMYGKNHVAILGWPIIAVFIFFIVDNLFTPIMVSRYLGFLHIPLVIVFAVGIGYFYRVGLARLASPIIAVLVFCAVFFHVLPFHRHALKTHDEPWKEIIESLCEEADGKTLVLTDQGKVAMKYYGDCFDGTLIETQNKQLDGTLFQSLGIEIEAYDSIFLLYRNHKKLDTDWVVDHQVGKIQKNQLGLVRLEPDPG